MHQLDSKHQNVFSNISYVDHQNPNLLILFSKSRNFLVDWIILQKLCEQSLATHLHNLNTVPRTICFVGRGMQKLPTHKYKYPSFNNLQITIAHPA